MGVFGYVGYWAHKWDERAGELLAAKRAQIAAHRQQEQQAAASSEAYITFVSYFYVIHFGSLSERGLQFYCFQ